TILAFSSYFIMVPNNINFDDPAAEVIEGFSNSFFSFEGMFTGLIVGMLAVFLFSRFTRSKLTIKMPGNVPPNVFDSFFSLMPFTVVVLSFVIIRIIIDTLDYASLLQLISEVLIETLLTVVTSLPAILLVILILHILWFVGLHGLNIVLGVV